MDPRRLGRIPASVGGQESDVIIAALDRMGVPGAQRIVDDPGGVATWTRTTSASTRALAEHTRAVPQIRVLNIADSERNYETYDVHGQF